MKGTVVLLAVLAISLLNSWAVAQYIPGDPNRGHAIYEQHLKSDLELLVIIAHGVVYSPMHGKRDILSDQEMWDVLQYIRTFAVYNVGKEYAQ